MITPEVKAKAIELVREQGFVYKNGAYIITKEHNVPGWNVVPEDRDCIYCVMGAVALASGFDPKNKQKGISTWLICKAGLTKEKVVTGISFNDNLAETAEDLVAWIEKL